MFTVIFAIPRTTGWVAQWMELSDGLAHEIARPRQIYTSSSAKCSGLMALASNSNARS